MLGRVGLVGLRAAACRSCLLLSTPVVMHMVVAVCFRVFAAGVIWKCRSGKGIMFSYVSIAWLFRGAEVVLFFVVFFLALSSLVH